MSRGPHTPDATLANRALAGLLREQASPSPNESTLPDPDEAELIRGALAGDERSFEALLRGHEATVLRVLRLLGVPPRDREDVAQEVFLRVFRYLRGFRPGRSFSGWIYRITVNAAHDHRQRLGRRRRQEAEWPEAIDEPPAPRAQRGADDAHLRRMLEDALGVLSERERAVFVLREIEGLSTREVARSLGITGITVRRHLGRARRSLQARLSDRARRPDGPGKKFPER